MTHLVSEVHRILRPSGHFFSLSSPSFLYNLNPPPSGTSPEFSHPLAELPSLRHLRETYARALRMKRAQVGAEELDPSACSVLGGCEAGEAVARVLKARGRGLRIGGEGKVGLGVGGGPNGTYNLPVASIFAFIPSYAID